MGAERQTAVTAVSRALDILNLLGGARDGLRLTDISRRLRLPHSTVHRLLATLRAKDFVAQDETTGLYFLSTHIMRLQANIAKRFHLIERAIPVLNQLAQASQETAHIAVLNDTDVVYLETRRSDQYLTFYAPSGRTAPAYCTGLGKVLLAYLPMEERRARLQRSALQPITPHTITDREQLWAQLEEIRRNGYALDLGEVDAAIHCVAAPIRNQTGQVIAALSVSGSSARLDLPRLRALAPLVVGSADEISHHLGWEDDGAQG